MPSTPWSTCSRFEGSSLKTHRRVVEVEKILQYHFTNERLLIQAIMRPSAVEGATGIESYERLEFLGDSVLGFVCASYVFDAFPEMQEGEMTLLKTALVSGEMLSRVSGDLGLAPLIILGESEKSAEARGMHKALEDVFEALVGALYLDGGISAAAEFITRVLLLPYASAQLAIKQVSAKSRLQEVVQASIKVSPTYKIVDQTGPDHSPTFVAVAMVEGRRVGRGTGASKKEAETASATDALINLGYMPAGGVDVS